MIEKIMIVDIDFLVQTLKVIYYIFAEHEEWLLCL